MRTSPPVLPSFLCCGRLAVHGRCGWRAALSRTARV